MLVISDTTPIISLVKINQLHLLESLFEKVVQPKAVYRELTENVAYEEEAVCIKNCSFLVCEEVKNQESVKILRNATGLDAGESEAIVLYEELQADMMVIDERKGRKVAKQLDLKHVGTVGILLQAYDEKMITAEEIKECFKVFHEKGIRMSEKLCQYAMEYIGEI